MSTIDRQDAIDLIYLDGWGTSDLPAGVTRAIRARLHRAELGGDPSEIRWLGGSSGRMTVHYTRGWLRVAEPGVVADEVAA